MGFSLPPIGSHAMAAPPAELQAHLQPMREQKRFGEPMREQKGEPTPTAVMNYALAVPSLLNAPTDSVLRLPAAYKKPQPNRTLTVAERWAPNPRNERPWRHYMFQNMIPGAGMGPGCELVANTDPLRQPTPLRWAHRPPDHVALAVQLQAPSADPLGTTLPLVPPWVRHGSTGDAKLRQYRVESYTDEHRGSFQSLPRVVYGTGA